MSHPPLGPRGIMATTMRVLPKILLLAALAVVAGMLAVRPYVDYLWLDSLGQGAVFWTRAGAMAAAFAAGFALGALGVASQLLVAARLWQGLADLPSGPIEVELRGTRVHVHSGAPRLPARIVLGWALAGGLLVGLSSLPLAIPLLALRHRAPFGSPDPVFGWDPSFYVFVLPVLQALVDRLFLALVLGAGVATAFYLARGLRRALRGWRLPRTVARHAQVLVGLLLLVGAAEVMLERWRLVVSGAGLAGGAGYVDVAVRMPALALLALLCAGGGLVLVFTPPSLRRAAIVMALLALAGGGGLALAPGAVQAWTVRPNEIAVERPYLEHGIASTARAFGLDRVTVRDYPALSDLDAAEVAANEDTLENVRLWDREPLLQTYQQIQALRQYYAFPAADVDRYMVDGRMRQVMLAAREVEADRLDEKARSWVNRRLKYTHGYGVALSPVNEFTPGDGLPVLWIRDLPPVSRPGLEIEQPALYFGESTDWYVLANSAEGELDHPKGETNVYSHYAGKGGFPVGGGLRRLALALYFGDPNVLISRAVTPETRALFDRDLRSRLQRLVPFLTPDSDPYVVVSGGRLHWIVDLYTATSQYPYSEDAAGVNYVRNPVKAIVDAYDGTVRLCVVDPDEPLLKTWRSVFPDLFVDEAAVEADLRAHFRYPEGLFQLQSEVYATYHMTQPEVFYNKEDLWAVPHQRDVQMKPYYVTMRLPGQDRLEFLQLLPLTPRGKDNMVAWMGARSDAPNRGELVLYRFPKERLVYGPAQIEARINQDPLISQQLSLWDQRGSQVIRGNLLVLPLDGSLVYFQPLYLQGSERSIPELKRVIVAVGDRVVMEPTLEKALASAVGGVPTTAPATAPAVATAPTAPAPSPEAPKRALDHFRRADEALKRGDWAAYGREMEEVRKLLEAMAAP